VQLFIVTRPEAQRVYIGIEVRKLAFELKGGSCDGWR
jgi:hypothetical protein